MGALSLKKHIKRPRPAVADLLNLAALVSDKIVLTKGGELLGGFYYRGRDLASSTHSERNAVTARLNQVLSKLGSGHALWMDAIRLSEPAYSPPSASHFDDPISRMIDAERREFFTRDGQQYQSEYVLALMWRPPEIREQKLVDLLYDDPRSGERQVDQLDKLCLQFDSVLQEIQDTLGDQLSMRRMGSHSASLLDKEGNVTSVLRNDLLVYLHYCITGLAQPINVPACAMYLDAYIGGQDLTPGDMLRIADSYVGVVNIEGLPGSTHPQMLDRLDQMAIPFRWSSRMVFLDKPEADKELKRHRRKWEQKKHGFLKQVFRTQGGVVNEDAVDMTKGTEAAMKDSNSGFVSFGFYTSVVVLYAPSPDVLEERSRLVAKELRSLGFGARIESINATEAWLGSIPGHPWANVRRPLLHTLNLADLVPTAGVWAGRSTNPSDKFPENSPPLMHCATSGSTPFRLNIHVGDVGHTLIFGPTGAGKSTLLALIVAQFLRYRNARVTAFDFGRSIYPLVSGVGGEYYELGGEGDAEGLCPLQYLDTAADAAWAEEWVVSCVELQTGQKASPRQKEAIHRAMVLIRQQPEGRSLTEFVTTVQDEAVRAAMAPYLLTGQIGTLLDASSDTLGTNRVQGFELSELMSFGPNIALPVLLYLFRRFERSLTGHPALLVLDEAWLMLGHDVFREKIREWLKTLRRANCAVVLATQSVSDALRSGIFDVMVESCSTKILLPNEEAETEGTEQQPGPAAIYRMIGLNTRQIEILKNGVKKRQYYYMSPEGRRLFELALGPVALSFVGVSDKENLREVGRFVAQFGDQWPFEWLKHRGVDYERYV